MGIGLVKCMYPIIFLSIVMYYHPTSHAKKKNVIKWYSNIIQVDQNLVDVCHTSGNVLFFARQPHGFLSSLCNPKITSHHKECFSYLSHHIHFSNNAMFCALSNPTLKSPSSFDANTLSHEIQLFFFLSMELSGKDILLIFSRSSIIPDRTLM